MTPELKWYKNNLYFKSRSKLWYPYAYFDWEAKKMAYGYNGEVRGIKDDVIQKETK